MPHHQAEVDVQIVAPADTVVSTPTRLRLRRYRQANLLRRASRPSGGVIERTGAGSSPLRNPLRTPPRTPPRKPLRTPLRDHAQGIKNQTGNTRKNGLEMQIGTRTTGTKGINGTREAKETTETTETRETQGNKGNKGTTGARGMRRLWLTRVMTRGNPRPLKVCLSLLTSLAQQLIRLPPTAILQSIQRDWDFMTDSECVPVHVALSLMDTSTLGKADREPEFLHMYNDIQKTLKAIVNGRSSLQWLGQTYAKVSCYRTPSGI